MSHTWPDQVEELRLQIREFIRSVVMPAEPVPGERLAEDERRQLQLKAKAVGVFAPQLSVELGSGSKPIIWWSPLFQEAGYSPIGPTVLNCMAPDEGNMHLLGEIASPEQRHLFLAPLARGEIRSCFAMTEPHPGAGSDPAALQTYAERTESGWVLNGRKRFISGAEVADFAIVMARTGPQDSGPAGATMFLVPMGARGVRLGARIHTIDRYIAGGHPHVDLDEVHVGHDAVLGEVGQGFRHAQARLGPSRLTHCMRWLGLARRSLDIALDRAEVRCAFGQPLHELGIVQGLLADAVVDIESADALITRTAGLLDVDPRAGTHLSSVAKVHCSEAIYRVIDRAVQICGGDGVSDALPLAQFLNEVRPFRIYDGPNETHRWAIARRASAQRRSEVRSGAVPMDRVVLSSEERA